MYIVFFFFLEVVRCDMDEVARNLYNFRLDHDYTPLTSPRRIVITDDEDDELVRTLRILDGPDTDVISMDLSEPPPLIMTSTPKPKQLPKIKLIQSITLTPPNLSNNVVSSPQLKPEVIPSSADPAEVEKDPEMPALEPIKSEVQKIKELSLTKIVPSRAKMKTVKPQKLFKNKVLKNKKQVKEKEVVEEEDKDSQDDEDDYVGDDINISMDDDDTDDSDFVIEDEVKTKISQKRPSHKLSKSKLKPSRSPKRKSKEIREEPKKELPSEDVKKQKPQEKKEELKSEEKQTEKEKTDDLDAKSLEKKPVKKEKKLPKPIPNDFALFSTPDIIRRVGGKEPTTPITPEPIPIKPAKIGEVPRKSLDLLQSQIKNRKSIDDKEKEMEKDKDKNVEHKIKENKERRISGGDSKPKRLSLDEKLKPKEMKSERRISDAKKLDKIKDSIDLHGEDIRDTLLNEDTRPFPMDTSHLNSSLESTLDTTGLDLDPALLDNLNNDEISEDILYKVAQSLVSNPEIQNAIDKGINDGVLDPMPVDNVVSAPTVVQPVSFFKLF